MGEYEELIAKVRGGDASALDTLEEKYSGSALREQAENASTKAREELLPDLRLAAFTRATKGMEFGDVDITVEDMGDVDPSEITPGFVESKLEDVTAAGNARRESLSQEAGFDTVEEFDAAMASLKKTNDAKQKKLEVIGGAQGGSGDPVPDDPKEPFEAMKDGYEAGKDQGMANDYAMAEGIHSLLTVQAPADDE